MRYTMTSLHKLMGIWVRILGSCSVGQSFYWSERCWSVVLPVSRSAGQSFCRSVVLLACRESRRFVGWGSVTQGTSSQQVKHLSLLKGCRRRSLGWIFTVNVVHLIWVKCFERNIKQYPINQLYSNLLINRTNLEIYAPHELL